MNIDTRLGTGAAGAEVRRLLRDDATVPMELTLQGRKRDVRMSVPRVAWERYGDDPAAVPDTAPVVYHTEAHALIVDLPAPEVEADE